MPFDKLNSTPENRPHLMAVVDTEEEFDWSKPYSREATSVEHMRRIGSLQDVFEAHDLQPVYAVDYAIATQPSAWQPLRRLAASGRASIGAHLHSWINPPFEEELSAHNSYQGNLPRALERAKLIKLTDEITKSFGCCPYVYKAGRYGIGPNTYDILSELGYSVDLSPAPPLDCSADGGPDFSRESCEPSYDPENRMVVIPGSGAFTGWWPGDQPALHRWATHSWRAPLHINSFLNRSGTIQRRWLSPESFSSSEMIALTRNLLAQGMRCFVISLHSPVVLPGATPFAVDESGVSRLLGRLGSYLSFFFEELGGKPWTPAAAKHYWSDRVTAMSAASNREAAAEMSR